MGTLTKIEAPARLDEAMAARRGELNATHRPRPDAHPHEMIIAIFSARQALDHGLIAGVRDLGIAEDTNGAAAAIGGDPLTRLEEAVAQVQDRAFADSDRALVECEAALGRAVGSDDVEQTVRDLAASDARRALIIAEVWTAWATLQRHLGERHAQQATTAAARRPRRRCLSRARSLRSLRLHPPQK